jgi:hypothetical protein
MSRQKNREREEMGLAVRVFYKIMDFKYSS